MEFIIIFFQVERASETLPFLTIKDFVKIKTQNRFIMGQVYSISDDYFTCESDDCKMMVNGMYKTQFLINRLSFKMEKYATEMTKCLNINNIFFPNSSAITFPKPKTVLKWRNNDIKSNPEQMQAVQNIVDGTANPYPFIIFGPPGTGKTKTLVEAICQIHKTIPNSRILVCAQSNAACDEIALRLLSYIDNSNLSHNIYRLLAANSKREITDEELLSISNYEISHLPALEILKKFRIVISTLFTAGRLAQARIDKSHFTHVFIDECGSATETAALIPIACNNH